MSVKNIMLAIPLQNINSASLAAGYTAANSITLSHSVSILRITNASNAAVFISFDQNIPVDSKVDNEFLPANEELEVNAQANSLPSSFACNFKQGTVIYFRGTAGVGNVYVSGYYQPIGV